MAKRGGGRGVVLMALVCAVLVGQGWGGVGGGVARGAGGGTGGGAKEAMEPSEADVRRMYDDVVGQLKNAQDRKNELAAENDKLKKDCAEWEKKTKILEARNVELERDASEYAARTYTARAMLAAFEAFLSRHGEIRASWEKYLKGDAAGERAGAWWPGNWPFGAG